MALDDGGIPCSFNLVEVKFMRPALTLLKLTDRYELKARLMPALLSCSVTIPGIAAAFNSSIVSLVARLSVIGGLAVVCAVGLAYVASMAGRRYEQKVWPCWPHDAPTNLWLHPDDDHCSLEQKRVWYAAIKRQVELDVNEAIAKENAEDIELVINDAVGALRQRFRRVEIDGLLAIHNEDYGFARNLAGLRVVWLPGSIVSTIVCWSMYFFMPGTSWGWGIIASLVLGLAILLNFGLPVYVRQRADRYAESFFGTLMELDRESS